MSDKEIIIASLQRVERRIRTNRLFNELTLGAVLFLAIPLLLKIWDLFVPLRGGTISIIVGIWVLLFATFAIWRVIQKGTLGQAARHLGGLHRSIELASLGRICAEIEIESLRATA